MTFSLLEGFMSQIYTLSNPWPMLSRRSGDEVRLGQRRTMDGTTGHAMEEGGRRRRRYFLVLPTQRTTQRCSNTTIKTKTAEQLIRTINPRSSAWAAVGMKPHTLVPPSPKPLPRISPLSPEPLRMSYLVPMSPFLRVMIRSAFNGPYSLISRLPVVTIFARTSPLVITIVGPSQTQKRSTRFTN